MSEENARGVADEARKERSKMPLMASPLAEFQVEIDPVTLMMMCLRMSLQIASLKRAVFGQAMLTASAEEWGRRWRERMKQLERDKADLAWEVKKLKERLGEG